MVVIDAISVDAIAKTNAVARATRRNEQSNSALDVTGRVAIVLRQLVLRSGIASCLTFATDYSCRKNNYPQSLSFSLPPVSVLGNTVCSACLPV